MNSQHLWIFLPFLFTIVNAHDGCSTKKECGQCIKTPDCVWCEELRNRPKCFNSSDPQDVICSQALYQENTLNIEMDLFRDNDPSTQMKPQLIKADLAGGSSESIYFDLYLLEQQPVDLYYLIDLTTYRKKTIKSLRRFGQRLLLTVKRLSKNHNVGLGIIGPNTNTDSCFFPPCPEKVGLTNLMSLSSNTTQFIDTLRQLTPPSTHPADTPVLDGVMQLLACRSAVGWRPGSRRFLVLSTNTSTDLSERDLLEKPTFPASCALGSEFLDLSATDSQHYTLPQVNYQARRRGVSLVVAIPEKTYRSRGNVGEGLHAAEIIKKKFHETWTRIELVHNATNGVTIDFYTNCDSSDPTEQFETGKPRNTCENVELGNRIAFIAELTTPDCTRNDGQTINIHPFGLQTKLVIDLTVVCECTIESAPATTTQSFLMETTPLENSLSFFNLLPPKPVTQKTTATPKRVDDSFSLFNLWGPKQDDSQTTSSVDITTTTEEPQTTTQIDITTTELESATPSRKCLTCASSESLGSLGCEELTPCVECTAYDNGSIEKSECEELCQLEITLVKDIDSYTYDADRTVCTFRDEKKCDYKFVYEFFNSKYNVWTVEEPKCPQESTSLFTNNWLSWNL